MSCLSLLVLLTFTGAALAQSDDADPPGRVARLSVAEGQVSLQPAGVEEWAAADVNRPLTTGDNLWVDSNSRAELDIGSAVIRLGSATGFSFLNLDDNTVQMRLTAGTAIVNVRQLPENQAYEVDTPNLAIALQRPGSYRVEVNGAGDATLVKVVDGAAEAAGGGGSYPMSSDQAATFTGTNELTASAADPGQPDALDAWSMQRDGQYTDSDSRRFVPDAIPGVQDLDAYGQWQYTPDNGYAWTPTDVPEDWAPYSSGCWTWVSPWGWTWVDTAPWGFAPFHYGRWVRWNNRWSWVPGQRPRGSYYAPALVAWVGGGGGIGVAWFPLGPREPYVPAYAVSERYLRNVNVASAPLFYPGRVNVRYINATIPGAVTAVPQQTFTSGRPIPRGLARPSPVQITQVNVSSAPPAIAPTRQSVMGPGGARPMMHPRPALWNRPVVARAMPPPAPVSFDRQLAAIHGNGDRPIPLRQLTQLRPAAPVASVRRVGPGLPIMRPSMGSPPRGAPAPFDTRSIAERERIMQTPQLPPSAPASRGLPSVSQPGAPHTNIERPQEGRPAQIPERAYEGRPPGTASPSGEYRPPVNTYTRPPEGRPPGAASPSGEYRPPVNTYTRPAEGRPPGAASPSGEYRPPVNTYTRPPESRQPEPPHPPVAPPHREFAPPPAPPPAPAQQRPPEHPQAEAHPPAAHPQPARSDHERK
jgi:hypothetical protein